MFLTKNWTSEIVELQKKQRKLLSLRWANFRRQDPSQALANNLNKMYDQTVVQLIHTCGQDAHVSEVDAEAWDEYWDWFDLEYGTRPIGVFVTPEMAINKRGK